MSNFKIIIEGLTREQAHKLCVTLESSSFSEILFNNMEKKFRHEREKDFPENIEIVYAEETELKNVVKFSE